MESLMENNLDALNTSYNAALDKMEALLEEALEALSSPDDSEEHLVATCQAHKARLWEFYNEVDATIKHYTPQFKKRKCKDAIIWVSASTILLEFAELRLKVVQHIKHAQDTLHKLYN